MVLRLSEKRHQEKKRKFEKEFAKQLSLFGSENLKKMLSNSFTDYSWCPTANQYLKMITASKFGGPNALGEGGIWADHAFHSVNYLMMENDEKPVLETGFYSTFAYSSAEIGNILTFISIEGSLLPYLTNLKIQDFEQANDIVPNIFLDKKTKAFGLLIEPSDCCDMEQYKEIMQTVDLDLLPTNYRRPLAPWEKGELPENRLGDDYSTGPLPYISVFDICVATTEELIQRAPGREQHEVSAFDREYRPGQFTKVKSHKRRNPLKSPLKQTTITDHVVYLVNDHLGDLKYIGEGVKDRPKHVNSGASHNSKINEHFFLKGPMTVEVIAEGLTKSESLAIEKLLLDKLGGEGLWNSKDYEPFSGTNEKQISQVNINQFLAEKYDN